MIDIAANVQAISGELTHIDRLSKSWVTRWIAPTDTAGSQTLFVAGRGGDDFSAGVHATTLSITVVDVTLPVITLSGSDPVNIELGIVYVDAGATAVDNTDGDITGNISIGGDVVDTNTVGTYVISYNVNDAATNSATQVNRTVNVTPDVTIPVITLNGSDPVNIELGTAYVDAGATAADNFDGDITASIVIAGDTVDINTVGTYVITFNVADAATNSAAQVNRTVNVTPDVTIPVITLNGSDPVNIELGTAYVDAGATAVDNIDGDITGNISVGGDVIDANTAGTYVITYDVADAATNNAAQVTRTINVTPDVTIPVITLNGSDPVNIELGTAYVDTGATAVDNIDGDVTANISVGGDVVDINTVGTYVITYDVADAATNSATQITRTVNVTPDVTIPVITLSGSDPVNIELGTAYVDAGAIAVDNIDGDITGNISVGGDVVDINTVGTYVITYNVNDVATNSADEVTRTVNVTPDITIPVLSVSGSDPVNIELGTAYVDAGATAVDNIDGDISGNIVIVNPVNVTVVGTYVITYNIQDNAGNDATEVTRTVNVTPDITIPMITLNGSDPVNIELGTAYVDAGAIALDNFDGDITSNIVVGGDVVDTSTVGTYVISYDAADAATNSAAQITRTVNVTPDVTIPVITLNGSDPVNIELGTAYVDAGATAVDNIDGVITGNIAVGGDVVDINTVGTYVITYDVADAATNSATQITRTVNVTPDVTIPVITLNGSNPVNIELGTAYVDAGATAVDNIDGDITSSIAVGGDVVDTNTVGTYVIVYSVQDIAGNNAAQATRTVNVTTDATVPVITLSGSDPVNTELGTAYVDAGATAVDNIDGDISGSIVIVNPVNIAVVGTYVITYNVQDIAGNDATQVARTVNVTPDVTIPVISLSGSDPVNIELGTTYIDAGATALDSFDGDITGSLAVGGDVVDTNTVGTYVITYDVVDAATNNAAQVTRTVNVTPDVTIPVIFLSGSDPVNIELGTTYIDAGATALDSFDGDITGSIAVGGDVVDTNTVGTYVITYDVADAATNSATQITRAVNVTPDITIPVITLSGSDPVNIELGTAYVDAGATAVDNIDGDITSNIVVGGDVVDTNTVGTYVITYNVQDIASNSATQVTRTINVTPDITIPVITLSGSDPVNIELGTAYVDAGATAVDNIDGDITASIVVAGDVVDTNTVGTYAITYGVQDTASNIATQVTRTVNVTADVTIPVITLSGSDPVNTELGTAYVDAGATAVDNIDGDITSSIVIAGDTVDINTVGTYVITYAVVDAATNNAAQVTRTVNVTPDVTIPVITLGGSDPVNIELGTAYVDAGATAVDNIDGDITSNIVVGGDVVDTNTVGTYVITFNVQDIASNSATQVTRTVNVTADVTIPVITLSGSDPVNVELGMAYIDAGATAVDNFDGDITGSIVIAGDTVDINSIGSYVITYNVQDATLNNAVQITRTVNVTPDVTIPVITLSGTNPVNIEFGTVYVDAGATAVDNIDGDITAGIVLAGDVVDTDTVGTYVITYNVQDANLNNAAQVTRTVNVTTDVTIPVITLSGSNPVNIELGTTYVDAGATAMDNIDGDISGNIAVGGDLVDTNTVGTYVISYNVADAATNNAAQITRTVNVTPDITIPMITLSGSDPVNIELGTPYVDAGATAFDNFDGNITGNIAVGGDVVDTNTVGTYVITYNVADAATNSASLVTRTVNVTPDVTNPVITLNGSDPVNIELGIIYVDAGATALDSFDGDITGNIALGGDVVDTSTVGNYVITYNVADSATNSAAEVTRTINVTPDITIPVITLNGSDPVSIELGTTYVDAGATAVDNTDGDITASIVVAGDTVDVNTVGTYVVTYNVQDTASNISAQVTRTVNVTADVTIPIITLTGSNPVNIASGTTYVDAGATAVDNIDGDITGNIVVGGDLVNINTAGAYVITYNVDDAATNSAAQVTRTVNVTAEAPTANAGSDQIVDENEIVNLDASASFDSDGSITDFSWSQTAGETVIITGADTATPTFEAPNVIGDAVLQFSLDVTDTSGISDTTQVTITVVNVLAVDAGVDQQVTEGNTVQLNGLNSLGVSSNIAGYRWIQTEGPAVVLDNDSSATPSFTAPAVSSTMLLVFELIITDSNGIQDYDRTFVNVRDELLTGTAPPLDIQLVNSDVAGGAVFQFNTTSDPFGLDSVFWNQIRGFGVTLDVTIPATPSFTAPAVSVDSTTAFEVRSTNIDGVVVRAGVNVNILGSTSANAVPTANAGTDQVVTEGDTAYLDATASTDSDGSIASYYWQQTGGPMVLLSSILEAQPSFVAPAIAASDDGIELNFEVVVIDTGGFVDRQSVTFTILDNAITAFDDDVTAIISNSGDPIGVQTINGSSLVTLQAVDPDTILDNVNRPVSLPYGLLDFSLRVEPGATVQIGIALPMAAGTDLTWWKYTNGTGWIDYSANTSFNLARDVIIISLTDNGIGDDDPRLGVIRDPGGLAQSSNNTTVPNTPVSNSGGGGGNIDPFMLLFLLFGGFTLTTTSLVRGTGGSR